DFWRWRSVGARACLNLCARFHGYHQSHRGPASGSVRHRCRTGQAPALGPERAAMTTGESRFWTFSLAVYADPAVQRECLALQDDHGVDVNLLLFCAFVGAVHGVALS